MPNTTSSATSPAFESIDLADLSSVQGGCGGKKKQCCSCAPQAVAIAAPPAPAPAPMAPPPPRESISTSVSVSYQ